ncbi:MAG TPA: DsbA family oxidoreductase [Thermomicrobiales bacterium]|nr:DsbA family oxidoreductase [Thermomicrobiales bacterium]
MRIDLYLDTVCPWCRIGKRNLERALAAWTGEPAEVRYHPFLLDPDLADEGEPFLAYFKERKGVDDPWPLFDRVKAAGVAAGLDFRFDRVERYPNTLRSHALLALAPGDAQSALLDRVQRAYFEEGRDIGDVATLAELAAEVGMDREATAAALRRDEVLAEARSAAETARGFGIQGVPFFVIDGRLAVSGAQPPERLIGAMRQAATTAATRA